MSEQQKDIWVLKSYDEQLNEMAKRVLSEVPGETVEHARFVANEINDAIEEINQTQREFLEGKHPNRLNWLTLRLSSIAKLHELKEEALYGAVLEALNMRQTAGLRAVVKGDEQVADIKLNGWEPKDNYERITAKETIGILADSVSDLEMGAVCEGILQPQNSQGAQAALVEQAMDSPLLSDAETALKRQVAIENYIAMRNDKSFEGSPMAGAIQTAVSSVEHMKKLYVMQKSYQVAYDNAIGLKEGESAKTEEREKQGEIARNEAGGKMDEYVKDGFDSGMMVTLEKALENPLEWLSENTLASIGDTFLTTTMIGPIVKGLLGIDLYHYNHLACNWIMKQANRFLKVAFHTVAEFVMPIVKTAAVMAAKVTVEIAKTVGTIVRNVGVAVCNGIKTVAKTVTTAVSSAWSAVKDTVSNVVSGVKNLLSSLFS